MTPLYGGVDSGVLSVDLDQEKMQFKLFSPLLESYLANTHADHRGAGGRRADVDIAERELGHLSRTEKKLYDYLSRHVGETCEFDQLWQDVWNSERADLKARRTIQVTVSRLRDKLPDSKVVIEPVRSRGYRLLAFDPPSSDSTL